MYRTLKDKNAEIIFVTNEHDYLPWDLLLRPNRIFEFEKSEKIICLSSVVYPKPKTRGKIIKEKELEIIRTENGTLYPSFKEIGHNTLDQSDSSENARF